MTSAATRCKQAGCSVCEPNAPACTLQGSEVPAIHVIGNHCLSVPRAHLLQRLRIPDTCYYSRRWIGGFCPSPGGSVSGWCGIQALLSSC